MNKEKRQTYQPVVTVEKLKNGVFTVLIIEGKRYVLDNKTGGKNK